jgi:hypothetical protein
MNQDQEQDGPNRPNFPTWWETLKIFENYVPPETPSTDVIGSRPIPILSKK